MIELYTAIYQRYVSVHGVDVRSLVSGMFQDEARQGQATPYITWSLISTLSDWTFTTDEDSPLIQFSIWDDDPSSDGAANIAKALIALYKDQLLTVTNFTMVRADKVGQRLLRDPDRGWQYIVEFRFLLTAVR